MASREGWESYKHVVDNLTKAGIEQESWGKRSSKKDLRESFQQARHNDEKIGDDIAGFSSSDDDDETNAGFTSANKTYLSSAKRALISGETVANKSKRQKKQDEDFNSPLAQLSQRTPGTIPHTTPDTISLTSPDTIPHIIPGTISLTTPDTISLTTPDTIPRITPGTIPRTTPGTALGKTPGITPHTTPAMTSVTSGNRKTNVKKWRLFSNTFESSFAAESPKELPSLTSFSHPTSTQEDTKDVITWSDSDSEDRKISLAEVDSPDVSSQDKIPFSTQNVKQEQQSQVSAHIDDFDSDSESCTEQLTNKESSPSISPNTPTPTPTPCTPPKEGESRPPLDSSKKRKQKYLRGGLAERLHKLTMQENSNRSFWLHKTQQNNRENDDDESPCTSAEGTVNVQVISESLDHSVYVIRCHVLSQDVDLPKHVIVLLESDRRKNLDIRITSTCLRIYSPWKILHLPKSSQPVLMCMAHCEVIPSASLDFHPADISDMSLEDKQDSQVVADSTEDRKKIDEIRFESNMEDKEEQDVGTEDTESHQTVVNWPLQDFLGCEGVSITTRVNVTARVQRMFWRNVEVRAQNLNFASSLTLSIIQNAKILRREKRMSLCFLVQGLTGSYCEVRVPEDILLNRTNWHEVLCQSEGTVLTFSKLRLVEDRNRKRARQLFDLIDSVKKTSSENQRSCFTFVLNEHSSVELTSEDKIPDYPNYSSPESVNLNDSNSAACIHAHRVKVCGKLLHAKFTSDKHYNTKHVRLWLSGKFIAQDCAGSDVTPRPAVSVIQVRYSSGRTVEWNESTLLTGQLLSMQDLVFDKGYS